MNAVLKDPSLFETRPLDELPTGVVARIHAVQAGDAHIAPTVLRRLAEIGFIPGEEVSIIGRGTPGGSPLAVRIGTSTFALRRHEARCVQIAPIDRT